MRQRSSRGADIIGHVGTKLLCYRAKLQTYETNENETEGRRCQKARLVDERASPMDNQRPTTWVGEEYGLYPDDVGQDKNIQ
jgi:hypothetical protein